MIILKVQMWEFSSSALWIWILTWNLPSPPNLPPLAILHGFFLLFFVVVVVVVAVVCFCFDFCFGHRRAGHPVGVQMPKSCAEPSEFHRCFPPWSSFPVSSMFSLAVSFNDIFQFCVVYFLWSSFRSFMEWMRMFVWRAFCPTEPGV